MAKSHRGNFGRQKVAVEKRRQKVVALEFSFSTHNHNNDFFAKKNNILIALFIF